jgi:hypothetical protein
MYKIIEQIPVSRIVAEYIVFDNNNNVVFRILKGETEKKEKKFFLLTKNKKNKCFLMEITDEEKRKLFSPYWQKYFNNILSFGKSRAVF